MSVAQGRSGAAAPSLTVIRLPTEAEEAVRDLCQARSDMVGNRTRTPAPVEQVPAAPRPTTTRSPPCKPPRGGPHEHRLTTLVDLLAELYTETGRTAGVVALRERHFTATGSQQTYHALRATARESPQWPNIRRRALDLLRDRAASRSWFATDTLAAVLLDEGEVDEAWRVTGTHPCSGQVRLTVTARRAETHPAEAIAVYRPLVAAAIAQTNNSGYAHATRLLITMHPLFARTGDDFAGDVGALKETNRRKRNFLAELTRNGL
jgi:uncharacterized Zn finger protein